MSASSVRFFNYDFRRSVQSELVLGLASRRTHRQKQKGNIRMHFPCCYPLKFTSTTNTEQNWLHREGRRAAFCAAETARTASHNEGCVLCLTQISIHKERAFFGCANKQSMLSCFVPPAGSLRQRKELPHEHCFQLTLSFGNVKGTVSQRTKGKTSSLKKPGLCQVCGVRIPVFVFIEQHPQQSAQTDATLHVRKV